MSQVLVFLTMLSAQALSQTPDGHESNGGDAFVLNFMRIGRQISSHLDLRQPQLLTTNKRSEFARAVLNTHVEMVPYRLVDHNGRYVMARVIDEEGLPGQKRIQVDIEGWRRNLEPIDRIQLVFHEYLRVIGVADDGYHLSRRLDVEAMDRPVPTREIPVLGDWDGDGLTNLALVRGNMWLFDLDNQGHLGEHSFHFGRPDEQYLSGDFDGDGRDVAVSCQDGRWIIDWDGRGAPGERVIFFGDDGDTCLVGDMNGDGRDDLVVYRQGIWFIDHNLDGETDAHLAFDRGKNARPLLADFNGDGRDEPTLRRRQAIWIQQPNGGVTQRSGGLASDAFLAGRFRRYDGSLPQERDYPVFFRDGFWFVVYAWHGEKGALVYGFGQH